jgi:hypothetical protein
MGSEFTFYDYFDADGVGTNIINDWLNGDGKEAKAYFNRTIGYLEGSPPAGFQDTVWRDPYVWPLHNEWVDFYEIRKKLKKVAYRLIGKVEGRNVFLVTWAYHKGKNWETDITIQTAKERVNQMKNDAVKYRREHDNS